MVSRCPGQDTQGWSADAIYDVPCPCCQNPVEFFKDEAKHRCCMCGEVVFNDRLNLSCALWCPSAKSCIGVEAMKRIEIIENNRSRFVNLRLLLEQVPEDDKEVTDLFNTLFVESPETVELFDTNRLYSVREKNPEVFERSISAFQAYLRERKRAADRMFETQSRTQHLLKRRKDQG